MWKTLAILAPVASVFLTLSVYGQSTSDLDAQWRIKIRPNKENGYSLASLREALKIAEKFGYEDPRLFETVVRRRYSAGTTTLTSAKRRPRVL